MRPLHLENTGLDVARIAKTGIGIGKRQITAKNPDVADRTLEKGRL